MTALPLSAFKQLHELETYFEPENAVMLEAELVETYGQDAVWSAIDEGYLEHRRLLVRNEFFSDSRDRCICWLSPRSRALVNS